MAGRYTAHSGARCWERAGAWPGKQGRYSIRAGGRPVAAAEARAAVVDLLLRRRHDGTRGDGGVRHQCRCRRSERGLVRAIPPGRRGGPAPEGRGAVVRVAGGEGNGRHRRGRGPARMELGGSWCRRLANAFQAEVAYRWLKLRAPWSQEGRALTRAKAEAVAALRAEGMARRAPARMRRARRHRGSTYPPSTPSRTRRWPTLAPALGRPRGRRRSSPARAPPAAAGTRAADVDVRPQRRKTRGWAVMDRKDALVDKTASWPDDARMSVPRRCSSPPGLHDSLRYQTRAPAYCVRQLVNNSYRGVDRRDVPGCSARWGT